MEDRNNYSDPDISNTTNETHAWHPHRSSEFKMRLITFLSISVCVGLPALVWAFRLLHLHRKIRGRISAFIVLLLLSDLIQLLLNLYTVARLFTDQAHPHSYKYAPSFSALSLSGYQLHQLVALEGVLTLKYPLGSAHIFSRPCYIIISILVIVFFIPSALNISCFSLGTILAPLILAVTFTITCKGPPTPVSKNTRSVVTVASVTLVMLYLPFILTKFVDLLTDFHISWYAMSVCLMSLRVISDPLLCVLVCRGNLRDVQTPQTHTEP